MPGVIAVAVQTGLTVLERMGFDLVELTRGLAFHSARDIDGPWIEWEDFATVLNRLGPEFDDACAAKFAATYSTLQPLARLIAPFVSSAHAFVELLLRVKPVYVQSAVACDEVRGDRLVVRSDLRPGLTPCWTWFRIDSQLYAHVTEVLGLPPLRVLGAVATPTSLRAEYSMPSGRPSRAQQEGGSDISLERILDAARLMVEAVPSLSDGCAELAPAVSHPVSEVLALQREHLLTRAEARVVLRLVDGLTPREVALALGISYETARTHLRRAYAKLDVSTQRTLVSWVEGWRGQASLVPRRSRQA